MTASACQYLHVSSMSSDSPFMARCPHVGEAWNCTSQGEAGGADDDAEHHGNAGRRDPMNGPSSGRAGPGWPRSRERAPAGGGGARRHDGARMTFRHSWKSIGAPSPNKRDHPSDLRTVSPRVSSGFPPATSRDASHTLSCGSCIHLPLGYVEGWPSLVGPGGPGAPRRRGPSVSIPDVPLDNPLCFSLARSLHTLDGVKRLHRAPTPVGKTPGRDRTRMPTPPSGGARRDERVRPTRRSTAAQLPTAGSPSPPSCFARPRLDMSCKTFRRGSTEAA